MKMSTKLLFIIILLLAGILRLYQLSSVPPSPFLDEVSNGYNAYSLLVTGNDEYGRHLPLLLQAYNDYRPAIFVYTLIPFIKIFGLTIFAIRFPSVILSFFSTACMFFLTKQLIEYATSERMKKNEITAISLISMLLFAISPWDIYSARVSVEINMSLAYFIFGTTAFLYWLRYKVNNWKSLTLFLITCVLYVIAFYSYHGIKLFLPFFALGLGILFYKNLLLKKRDTIFGIILSILLLIPLIISFTSPNTTVRFWAVNIYTQQPQIIAQSATRILHDKTTHDVLGEIIDNRRILLSQVVINSYLKNFDFESLFLSQVGSKSYVVPDTGPFYLFELPLFFIALYFLIFTKKFSIKSKLFLLIWILTSVIPSGISTESPQLNRMNTLLPAYIIIISIGLYYLFHLVLDLKNKNIKLTSIILIFAILVISFVSFVHSFFIEYPYLASESYQYGITQALTYAKENENKYQYIVVSNNNEFLESYMYYLFVNKYSPQIYQKSGGTHSAFFTDSHAIGKYDFRNPNLFTPPQIQASHKGQHILYLVNPLEINKNLIESQQLILIKKYYYLDGTDAIWIYSGRV